MSTDKQNSDTTIINETQNENETTALAVSTKPNERKFKIPIFKGDHTRKVSIDNWLKWYEMKCDQFGWDTKARRLNIGDYLDDEALDFYINNCSDKNMSWEQIVNTMTTRFATSTVHPIVDFVYMRQTS